MKKRLIIYLGRGAPELVHYAEKTGDAPVLVKQGSLAELGCRPGWRVIVLVPGTEVLLTEVAVPGGRKRVALQSIPYLLEDNLADDVDQLHFATGPLGRDGRAPVAVVGRTRMAEWLKILAEAGLEADRLIPAPLALPVIEGGAGLFIEGEFILRTADWQALALDRDNIHLLAGMNFGQSVESGADSVPLRIFSEEGFAETDLEGLPKDGLLVEGCDSPLTVLAEGYSPRRSINLLTGEYGRSTAWQSIWQVWRLPVLLLAGLLVFQAAGLIHQYLGMKRERQELLDSIDRVYRDTFPDSRRVVNARSQMKSKLRVMREDSGLNDNFIEVFGLVAPRLRAAPGFQLKGFRYREGRFSFDLEVDSLQILEELQAELSAKPGLLVELLNASSSGEKVSARLQIKGGGS